MGWTTFLPILVLLWRFVLSFWTYQPTPVRRVTWPCDLDIWPWEVTALVADAGLRVPSAYQVWSSVRKILHIYCVSINRFGDLNLWPFGLKIGPRVTRVMCFHPAKFGFPKPFRSRVMSRYATDRQTDGRTVGRTDRHAQFIMSLPIGAGENIIVISKNPECALTCVEQTASTR